VSVPDDVYRNARVAAAQRDTSVSALVVAFLEQLSGRMDEFARLEALQREVQAGIGQFRAAGRLSRDEVHDRSGRPGAVVRGRLRRAAGPGGVPGEPVPGGAGHRRGRMAAAGQWVLNEKRLTDGVWTGG
jgi:hypothetical protein